MYWNRRLSRRAALRKSALLAGGLSALSLVGCGGGSQSSPNTASQPGRVVDSTTGKVGGKLTIQSAGYMGTPVLVKTNNNSASQHASLSHSGLYTMRSGRPGVDGLDLSLEPDLAVALPEQPDPLTYVIKVRPAKFHNGDNVTSADVKYSYERYAFGADSAYKPNWIWLDKVETPDPSTVVVKTKMPYADTLGALVARFDGFILSKAWEEGPNVGSGFMGSGPFQFVDTQAPVITRYKRNPNYFMAPYPYFDTVDLLGTTDATKKVADYISKQVQMSYWFSEEDRDQIRSARADAVEFGYPYPAHHIFLRTDQAPMNDERVRLAMSMSIDRDAIRKATSKGEGEPDQVLSWTNPTLGFRKPKDLGPLAKNFERDLTSVKQLLSAAGISQPIEMPMSHWDGTVIGQAFVDAATLVQTHWRTAGVARIKDQSLTFAQATTTMVVGNYDGVYMFPGGAVSTGLVPGINLRSAFFASSQGITAPTLNTGHVVDSELSSLVDKQLGQLNLEERKQTLRRVEEILAAKMYRIPLSTYTTTFFGDKSIENMQIPALAVNGSINYIKYWWYK